MVQMDADVSVCEAGHISTKKYQPAQRHWIFFAGYSAREELYWAEEVNLRLRFRLGPPLSRRLDWMPSRGSLNYTTVL